MKSGGMSTFCKSSMVWFGVSVIFLVEEGSVVWGGVCVNIEKTCVYCSRAISLSS